MERNAFAKQRIMPETALYTVADLSRVWVIADVFEYEAAGVRIGMPATLTLSYLPGRTFRGTVNYILPQVDAATRTLKVRIEFANPDFALEAGHVRRGGIPDRRRAQAGGAANRRAELRRPPGGLCRSRQGLLRAARGEDRARAATAASKS